MNILLPCRLLTFALPLLVFLISGCGGADREGSPPQRGGTYLEPQLKNVTRLTSQGDNGEAYFSFDDARLIFQSNRGGEKCDKIWMMNSDGSGKKRISSDHGAHTCSFFFPDNKRVVYASTAHLPGSCPPRPERPPGARYFWPLHPYDIFAASMDGTKSVRLTDNPEYDAEPIVSSDGKQIVFGSKRHGDFDIYIMNSDGGNVRRLTNRVGYDGGPWFSPDGKKIAWRAWHPRTKEERELWQRCMTHNYIVPVPLDLWVMNSDGTNKKRLTSNGAVNWAPSWHPDGRRIVFSSNMDDWHEDLKKFGHNFELYIISASGGRPVRLTRNNVFDGFPMFSHSGKKIVFASNRNPDKPRATDIFIADWVDKP